MRWVAPHILPFQQDIKRDGPFDVSGMTYSQTRQPEEITHHHSLMLS